MKWKDLSREGGFLMCQHRTVMDPKTLAPPFFDFDIPFCAAFCSATDRLLPARVGSMLGVRRPIVDPRLVGRPLVFHVIVPIVGHY